AEQLHAVHPVAGQARYYQIERSTLHRLECSTTVRCCRYIAILASQCGLELFEFRGIVIDHEKLSQAHYVDKSSMWEEARIEKQEARTAESADDRPNSCFFSSCFLTYGRNGRITIYDTQAIAAEAGMVETHAHTILVAVPHRTAFNR